MEKLYSVQEVADLLKITRVSLYGYLKAKKIKAAKVGKYWYITEQNLKDFIEQGSGVVKNGVEQGAENSDFGKYALAEVENNKNQKRENPTNRLSADLYLISQMLQECILQNSELLQLNAGDKNTINDLIQFLYSKTELIYNKGENTTYMGKENAHLLNLNKANRALVNAIVGEWLENNQYLENSSDSNETELYNDVHTLVLFTKE